MGVVSRIGALKSYSRVTGVMVALTGCSVIIGWLFDVPVLKSLIPGLVPMNPATAVCFVLSGLALSAQGISAGNKKDIFEGMAEACAFVVFIIALAKLIGLLNHNLGVDQILFRNQLEKQIPPNRMAPNTAVNFLLVSLSLLIIKFQTPKGYRPSEFTVLTSLFIAMFALLGYFFGIQGFYDVKPYLPMALNTALLFNAMAVGILYAYPDRGLMSIINSENAGGRSARRILPAVIGVPIFLSWLRWQGRLVWRFHGTEFGLALVVVLNMIIIAAVVWWHASLLNKIDDERKKKEEALAGYRGHLEELIKVRTLALEVTEARYRRLFEAAKDGILILDVETGRIVEANPFVVEMLGYSREELLGKELWEIGFFKDITNAKEAFLELKSKTYLRYEDMPLQTKDARMAYVEFVSNVYVVDHRKVMQCHIRDITERKKMQDELSEKVQDLERFSVFAVDRELTMEKLEKKIKELEERLKAK